MKGNNALFRSDPERFLKSKGILCSKMSRNSQVGDFANINGFDCVEFDLVPKGGSFVELTVLGAIGTYGKTKRKGKPIVGHFLHWNGQTYKQGPATFGKLDLSACTADYVFTAPFTGCRFVVTRSESGGNLKVYHEPTEDGVCNYPDPVILEAGPTYEDNKAISGNGVLWRRGGGWKVIVSTMEMGHSPTVLSYDIP